MPEYRNFCGALLMTVVSAIMPNARRAGTEFLRPFTIKEALALENPSLEAEVGTLINGSLRRKPMYFAASMTFPPPSPMTACVAFGSPNARLMISSMLTVSSLTVSQNFDIGFSQGVYVDLVSEHIN